MERSGNQGKGGGKADLANGSFIVSNNITIDNMIIWGKTYAMDLLK